MKTPVAFLIFNRPDTTEKVFEKIRQAKPPKLLVIADGPRVDHPDEAEKCAAARAIIDSVDWECEVLKNYSDENLGCKQRVSSGLDWVFENVEEAIILEDDCLPHPTFFRFCEELLEKYRDDERVMKIDGTNILSGWKSNTQSYHFSCFGFIWGWASWRRAWNHYDVDMKLWSEPEAKNRVRDVICDHKQYLLVERRFDKTQAGLIDSWDYQWTLARILQSGLSIIPSVNLISNIGFTKDATHTKTDSKGMSNLQSHQISFPLIEPVAIAVDRDYDRQRRKRANRKNLFERIKTSA